MIFLLNHHWKTIGFNVSRVGPAYSNVIGYLYKLSKETLSYAFFQL